MNDKELRQNVIDELDFEPSISAADIGVIAEHGVVTLAGHVHAEVEASHIQISVRDGGAVDIEGGVDNWDERQAVVRAAWSAPGVLTVNEHLKIG